MGEGISKRERQRTRDEAMKTKLTIEKDQWKHWS